MLSVLRRLGERCSDLSEEYIPDPYVIAIVLTFVAVAAAIATGAGPRETMSAWTGGVWSLLPFMAAISNEHPRENGVGPTVAEQPLQGILQFEDRVRIVRITGTVVHSPIRDSIPA